MKRAACAFFVLIVGTLAGPRVPVIDFASKDQRVVTGQIIKAIESAAQSIRDAGYDPYGPKTFSYQNELPVAVLGAIDAYANDVYSEGLSNIVVDSMSFSVLTNRLTFSISIPSISVSIDSAAVKITFFGQDYEASLSGNVAIVRPRIAGNIRVSIGIISGISIRSMSFNFNLGGIESDVSVNILGNDLSQRANTFLGTTVPETLTEFASEINELIEAVAWQIADRLL